MNEKEFFSIARDIIRSDEYLGMKQYRHHIRGSVYDHSLKAAWLCYQHYKRFGTKIDLQSFIRGALLHDYYLYDWHKSSRRGMRLIHGFSHPRSALTNASAKYPDLTPIERDMILRHMFPLTPIPPRTKAGWLLCFYDKIAAVSDYFGENRWKTDEPKKNRKKIRINISQTNRKTNANNQMVKYSHNQTIQNNFN